MLPFTKKHWSCNNMKFEGIFGQAALYIHDIPSAQIQLRLHFLLVYRDHPLSFAIKSWVFVEYFLLVKMFLFVLRLLRRVRYACIKSLGILKLI